MVPDKPSARHSGTQSTDCCSNIGRHGECDADTEQQRGKPIGGALAPMVKEMAGIAYNRALFDLRMMTYAWKAG